MNGPQFVRRSKRGRLLGLLAIVAWRRWGRWALSSSFRRRPGRHRHHDQRRVGRPDLRRRRRGQRRRRQQPLLIDYPEPQRGQILDYLFKPGYGASLQILKVEIGGDTNSTSGAEPSHAHFRGDLDCDRGYEWWIMEQAKPRNPDIKLVGLAVGRAGLDRQRHLPVQDLIDYLLSWLGCAQQHNLTIDYLVPAQNERQYDANYDHQPPHRAQRQRLRRREARFRRRLSDVGTRPTWSSTTRPCAAPST